MSDGARTAHPWSANTERGVDGALRVAGISVRDLADRFGTPAYILDEDDLRSRARAFREAFESEFKDLSGAGVYYASKAFLCTAVARWVREEGLGIDVASGGELEVALRAGIQRDLITLHGNNKSEAEIDRAVSARVGHIVVDSLEEIDLIAEAAQRHNIGAVRVLVRVTTGVHAGAHESIATAHEDQKFGLSITGGQALEAVRRIEGRRELWLSGLHSHIGSQILQLTGYVEAAERLLGFRHEVAKILGRHVEEVVLGGGFGIPYVEGEAAPTPDEIARCLANTVRSKCEALGVPVPRVSIEPGRAIAGPSTLTLYSVGTVKLVDTGREDVPKRSYVSVDGGMSDNIRTALYDAKYTAALADRNSPAEPARSRVVGIHCESGDIVVRDVELPGDIRRGDLLAVPATGAFGRSMASNYNHTPRPPVIAVHKGVARVVIRRETIDDILALDVEASTAGLA